MVAFRTGRLSVPDDVMNLSQFPHMLQMDYIRYANLIPK